MNSFNIFFFFQNSKYRRATSIRVLYFLLNCLYLNWELFCFQLMVGTLDGVSIRHVVPHVVEVCSREQDHALLLLHQMAAKTVVFLGQAQNQGTAVPHHAQVSVQNYICPIYAQCTTCTAL